MIERCARKNYPRPVLNEIEKRDILRKIKESLLTGVAMDFKVCFPNGIFKVIGSVLKINPDDRTIVLETEIDLQTINVEDIIKIY